MKLCTINRRVIFASLGSCFINSTHGCGDCAQNGRTRRFEPDCFSSLENHLLPRGGGGGSRPGWDMAREGGSLASGNTLIWPMLCVLEISVL